jgi:hypothetical protein
MRWMLVGLMMITATGPLGAETAQLVTARAGEVAATVARLEVTGAQVVTVLPGNAILVLGAEARSLGVKGVEQVRRWRPEEATRPLLATLEKMNAGVREREIPVVLGLASPGRLEQQAHSLAAAGAVVAWLDRESFPPQLGLTIPAPALHRVLTTMHTLDGLVWADLQPPLRLRNRESTWRCQSGLQNSTPVFEHGLHGEGQIVGIMDTGIDIDMCFFSDVVVGLPALNDDEGTGVNLDHRKVLAVDFYYAGDWPDPAHYHWDSDGHGTHVAGTVAGDDGSDGLHFGNDGMAPAARLVIQDGGYHGDDCADLPGLGCPVRTLGPVLQQAYDQGARIHSNSWGDEENYTPHNRYTERTAEVDRFCWFHKDMLVVFAGGNAGPGSDTVGSPATGKNVVAVGATWHGDEEPLCVVDFSSRGWTHDGRIKPDVVAPGVWVESADSDGTILTENCATIALSGTSMACPTVAGLAALVRQYYMDGYYPDGEPDASNALSPTAALVKATLIASAVDMSEFGCWLPLDPIPSRDQGWGLVQLDRALYFPGDAERLVVVDWQQGFASTGDPPVDLRVEVMEPGPLKAVLVWTDPPSSWLAEVNLVNDLDLVVAGPDGRFLGNVFADGVSVTGGEPDRLNNVEVVLVPEAVAGTWTVAVSPHVVDWAPQDFALVVTGAVETIPPRRAHGRLGG